MDIERLNPTEFSLVGFHNPKEIKVRRIEGCGLRRDPLRVDVLRYATYQPAIQASARETLYGGFRDATGAYLPAHQLRRGGNAIVSHEGAATGTVLPIVDEPVLWLGWLFSHFGHFLLESLSRMWAVAEWPGRFLFHSPEPDHLAPVHWRTLELMGVPRSRVIELQSAVIFATVHCPETAFEVQHFAHPAVVSPFAQAARNITRDATRSGQPIYLSRSRLPAEKRRIQGEAEFEQELQARGVRIFHPQEYSIDEQILTLNRHETIVASNGSAAHLLLFCAHRPKLHLLTQERLSQDYFLCSHLARAPTWMVRCFSPAPEDSGYELRLDTEIARQHLLEQGVIG